jgi:hypothetical protein
MPLGETVASRSSERRLIMAASGCGSISFIAGPWPE